MYADNNKNNILTGFQQPYALFQQHSNLKFLRFNQFVIGVQSKFAASYK